jgi:hypothetical protein
MTRRRSRRIIAPEWDRRARGDGVDSLQGRDYQMIPSFPVVRNEAFFNFAGRLK